MADADRLVAALRYQQEMEEANRAAYGNPSIMRQGSRSMKSPEQKAKVRENVMDVAKFVTGETPGEIMFNVATLPLGVPARLAAGGMSLLTASDEAEAGKGAIAKTTRDKLVAALGFGKKKQALIDSGYYHQIGGGKKLDVPVEQMLFTATENTPKVPQTIISPESMQGSTLVPAVGDRTAAGMMLTDINNLPLANPVQLEGGADFMRTHAPYNTAWALDKGGSTALSKKIRVAGEKGDVYMPHVAMSATSGDFSTMMADALLEQMRGANVSKTAKLEFDRAMRRVRPEWKGIDSTETLKDLENIGEVRKAFIAEANLDTFANRGFPNITRTRVAITDPNLMNVPMHSSGYTVAKMNPEGFVVDAPTVPHKTYSHQLSGQYAGGFERPIPRDIMFPDFYSKRRAMSSNPAGDVRSFQLSNPTQKADQQWLDGVMQYLREAKD